MADEHDHPGVIHDQKYCAICKTEVSINDTKFSTTQMFFSIPLGCKQKMQNLFQDCTGHLFIKRH